MWYNQCSLKSIAVDLLYPLKCVSILKAFQMLCKWVGKPLLDALGICAGKKNSYLLHICLDLCSRTKTLADDKQRYFVHSLLLL